MFRKVKFPKVSSQRAQGSQIPERLAYRNRHNKSQGSNCFSLGSPDLQKVFKVLLFSELEPVRKTMLFLLYFKCEVFIYF